MKTLTPKQLKKNCKEALKRTKEELVKVIFKEKEIQEEKEKLINEINYWEVMAWEVMAK